VRLQSAGDRAGFGAADSVWNIADVSNGAWVYNQRYHQYVQGFEDTRNGVGPLDIDISCADSSVAPADASDSEGEGPGGSEGLPPSCNPYFGP
jgi:hypothetical protein